MGRDSLWELAHAVWEVEICDYLGLASCRSRKVGGIMQARSKGIRSRTLMSKGIKMDIVSQE